MSKRYFKIEFNGYGGEYTIGRVTADFVEYWKDRDEDELIDHINNVGWGDEVADTESPDMTDDGNLATWECDDIDHLNGCYADNGYWVTEVALKNPDAWDEDYQVVTDPYENEEELGDSERIDDFANSVYGRELYTCSPDTEGELVPVLQWHSSEKGNFGIAYVVTDGEDFNPDLLSITTVETDLAEFVETVWYGETQLEICYDWADTNGKGLYASVGYVNPDWLDASPEPDEVLEQIRDNMQWLEDNAEEA